MKNIKLLFWILLGVMSLLWMLADSFWPQPFNYFSFRQVFLQYSGVIGITVMSVAMLLALRPRWAEHPLGGLDKIYRLHKWLGITGLAFAILHWWFARGTKWMVEWGWLERPERRHRAGQNLSDIEQWFRGQRGLAESLGEWAFYAVAVLIVLALVKWFPYHWFKKTHKWLALVYLVLVYHSFILLKTDYWLQPLGWVLAILLFSGVVSALMVLAGRVGSGCKVKGVIEALSFYPGVKVIEGSIKLDKGWRGHQPGQFAFVTSSRSEGAHPYSIASCWNAEDRSLTFVVKSLGDWTGQLKDRLKVGMPVTVEGPYGCFDFTDGKQKQIWVGAGIGITPFIAKMKQLALISGTKDIDLFHPTSDVDQAALDRLVADAAKANIRLHLRLTRSEGRLTPEQICQQVPDWRSASIWFCGPAAYGQAIKRDLVKLGLPSNQFHQELFEMR